MPISPPASCWMSNVQRSRASRVSTEAITRTSFCSTPAFRNPGDRGEMRQLLCGSL